MTEAAAFVVTLIVGVLIYAVYHLWIRVQQAVVDVELLKARVENLETRLRMTNKIVDRMSDDG